jgi:hypothetical protein
MICQTKMKKLLKKIDSGTQVCDAIKNVMGKSQDYKKVLDQLENEIIQELN